MDEELSSILKDVENMCRFVGRTDIAWKLNRLGLLCSKHQLETVEKVAAAFDNYTKPRPAQKGQDEK